VGKLSSQGLQYFQRCLRPAGAPMRSAEDEQSERMTGTDGQDFAGLLRGEVGVFLEQAPRMRHGDVDRPKALRGHVQSCTRFIPKSL
jgi:hypothetical protein